MNWYKTSQIQNSQLETLRQNLKQQYPGLELDSRETSTGYIELAQISLPTEMQNQGIGTKIIQQIQALADSIGKAIVVRPEADKGKKGKLDRFYNMSGKAPSL